MENIVSLNDVVVSFDQETVLNNISLDIKDKEFVTLLGPSGCGKTTTLRIIGGFLSPDKGNVIFEGKNITNLPPYKRNVNTVFQKYALFPHLNVYENIAFGLRVKKLAESEIKTRVGEMLDLVNLKGFENRAVQNLSGGQQQRVAIARALVNRPKVLLLDEPLGALDLKLRKEMQTELKRIQQSLEITFVYVTHDQEEALTMSDTVVVMKDGNIQQIGAPVDIYNEPKNAFVADFIGESNIIEGIMLCDRKVLICSREFECVDSGFGENAPVDVVIRPEDITLISSEDAKIKGIVRSVTFKGVHYEMVIDTSEFSWLIHSTKAAEVNSEVGISFGPDDIHIMAVFVIVPLIMVAYFAFFGDGEVFTLEHIKDAAQYGGIFARSIWLAAVATVICLIISYPLAFILSRMETKSQSTMLMIVMLPMWMNFLLRTYAWMTILGNEGVLNYLFGLVGLGPFRMLNTQGAIVLGMVYNYLPYMILPLYSVMEKIDNSVLEAAQDLGCGRTQALIRVVVPLSLPGIMSGITMVFVPAISTFIISRMLGGGSNLLIGDLIEMQFLGNSYNPNLGAAISLILMVIVLIIMTVMRQFDSSDDDRVLL